MPEFSNHTKSAITSDLMFFKALLMFAIWVLESFINYILLSIFIGMIICFPNCSFMVMLNFWFGLIYTSDDFLNVFNFLFCKLGNIFLISKVFLVMLVEEVWAYNFIWSFFSIFFLEYLENLLIFLDNFAKIEGGSLETETGLFIFKFLPFLVLLPSFILGVN